MRSDLELRTSAPHNPRWEKAFFLRVLLAFQWQNRILGSPRPNLLLTGSLPSASGTAHHSHWLNPCLSLSQHTWSLPDSQTHSFQAPSCLQLLSNRPYMLGMLIHLQIHYLRCRLFHEASHWQENGDSWLPSHRLPSIPPLLPWSQHAFIMNSQNLPLIWVCTVMRI